SSFRKQNETKPHNMEVDGELFWKCKGPVGGMGHKKNGWIGSAVKLWASQGGPIRQGQCGFSRKFPFGHQKATKVLVFYRSCLGSISIGLGNHPRVFYPLNLGFPILSDSVCCVGREAFRRSKTYQWRRYQVILEYLVALGNSVFRFSQFQDCQGGMLS
ncbi:hypothetical protein STEG23_005707, partial [Scotinomys teguina]